MNKSLEKVAGALRAEAAAFRESGQHRYSEPFRAKVVACLLTLREAGASWDECKEQLGICKATLHNWFKNSSTSSTAMVRVRVKPDASQGVANRGLVLQTPNGNQLSGFDLAEAAQLLRALG